MFRAVMLALCVVAIVCIGVLATPPAPPTYSIADTRMPLPKSFLGQWYFADKPIDATITITETEIITHIISIPFVLHRDTYRFLDVVPEKPNMAFYLARIDVLNGETLPISDNYVFRSIALMENGQAEFTLYNLCQPLKTSFAAFNAENVRHQLDNTDCDHASATTYRMSRTPYSH
jgi:hypothetical protein